MSTRTKRTTVAPKPGRTTKVQPVALDSLPEQVANVKRTITLRGVAAFEGKSESARAQAAVGLAFLKARGNLPSTRTVEEQTGISKSRVSRMLAIGAVAVSLTATLPETTDFQYLYECPVYGGSLSKVEKAFGKPLATTGARTEALEWIGTEAARLRAMSTEDKVATRTAQPDDGTKGAKGKGDAVKIPATFAAKVAAAHAIVTHLGGKDVEIPAPGEIDAATHAMVVEIVQAAQRLALATGDAKVKPVRQARRTPVQPEAIAS